MSNCNSVSKSCTDNQHQFTTYEFDQLDQNAARQSVIVRAGGKSCLEPPSPCTAATTTASSVTANTNSSKYCVAKRHNSKTNTPAGKVILNAERGRDSQSKKQPKMRSKNQDCNKFNMYSYANEQQSRNDTIDSGYNSVADVDQCMEQDNVTTGSTEWSSRNAQDESTPGSSIEQISQQNFESTTRSTSHRFVFTRKLNRRNTQEEVDEIRLGNGHLMAKDRLPRTGQLLHLDHRYKPYSESPSSSSSTNLHSMQSPHQDTNADTAMNLSTAEHHAYNPTPPPHQQHHPQQHTAAHYYHVPFHRCLSDNSLVSLGTTHYAPINRIQDAYSLADTDADGDTALHLAVTREDEASVNYLTQSMIIRRISLDICNRRHQTSLHIAVITGHIGIIKKLMSSGACPLVPDHQGNSTVHVAVQYSNLEVIEAVLNFEDSIKALKQRNYNGFTPLHLAIFRKDLNIISLLLSKGTDCNCVDGTSGRTPLFHAVANGQEDVVAVLINHGASVNVPNYAGVTPLIVATDKRLKTISRLLISKGATMNAKDDA
ncbi:B-cell lymphoma 3 protein [Chamberlinius hualienensis]